MRWWLGQCSGRKDRLARRPWLGSSRRDRSRWRRAAHRCRPLRLSRACRAATLRPCPAWWLRSAPQPRRSRAGPRSSSRMRVASNAPVLIAAINIRSGAVAAIKHGVRNVNSNLGGALRAADSATRRRTCPSPLNRCKAFGDRLALTRSRGRSAIPCRTGSAARSDGLRPAAPGAATPTLAAGDDRPVLR